MHANNDPTHRGHGNSPPEQHRAPSPRAAPGPPLTHIFNLYPRRPAPFLAGLLRKQNHCIRLASGLLTPPITPSAPAPTSPPALVAPDTQFVDPAEHLGRIGVDPVGPGPLEFLPAVPARQQPDP